jgi:hypothetical protein
LSRLAYLKQDPKRSLTALATLLAAVGIMVGSGANFTSSTANPANTFSAGILSSSNSKSGSAILTATNMVPGGSQSGTVVISNTGNVPGTFSLAESNLVDSPRGSGNEALSGKLDLLVEDVTGGGSSQVYSGKLGAMGTRSLGSYTAGMAKTYKFTVSFPDGTAAQDNPYQGTGTSVKFDWTSTS